MARATARAQVMACLSSRELRGRRSANFPNNFQQQRGTHERDQDDGGSIAARVSANTKLRLKLCSSDAGESLRTHRATSCPIPLTPPSSSDTDARRCLPHVWPQWRVSLELKAPGRKKITPDTCSARHYSLPTLSAPAYAKLPFSPVYGSCTYPAHT